MDIAVGLVKDRLSIASERKLTVLENIKLLDVLLHILNIIFV